MGDAGEIGVFGKLSAEKRKQAIHWDYAIPAGATVVSVKMSAVDLVTNLDTTADVFTSADATIDGKDSRHEIKKGQTENTEYLCVAVATMSDGSEIPHVFELRILPLRKYAEVR